MDAESFNRREKMLELKEELLTIEKNCLSGLKGVTLDELDKYLDEIIDKVERNLDKDFNKDRD